MTGLSSTSFSVVKLAVFCDGDFWHRHDWNSRKAKLAQGANSGYWIQKIERNMQRGRRQPGEP